MKSLVAIALLAGCADETCRIEDSVDEHIARSAVDCGTAQRRFGQSYEPAPFQAVHDCMANAIATATPFVGVYLEQGVEGAARHAFIGTRDGTRLTYQLLFQSYVPEGTDTAMTRTICSDLTPTSNLGELGYACEGADVVVCTP